MILKIKVRENLPIEITQHGCYCNSIKCHENYINLFSGKIVEFLDPVTDAPNFKCGTKFVWPLADNSGGCCEHQLELD